MLPTGVIFNFDTDYCLVEPMGQCTYNARALNEEETRAACGMGKKERQLCPVLR